MFASVVARHAIAASAAVLFASLLSACASGGDRFAIPAESAQTPDAFLHERGAAELELRHWLTAREYFRRLVDTYPTSQYRQDAKLGIGDSYLGERRLESDILAAGEFREFLRFYPLADRADYAQYRLAVSQMRQMLSPQRDQTATREALRELQVFTSTYTNSKYLPEVIALERETRDRLSESEYLIGRHYYRSGWYPGAVSRLETLLKTDPQYTHRDGAYFFLAEAYAKLTRIDDARTYYQKVIDEFAVSDFLDDAAERLKSLEGQTTATAAPPESSSAPDAPSTPPAQAPAPAPTGTTVAPATP